jgi:hypothetical protein
MDYIFIYTFIWLLIVCNDIFIFILISENLKILHFIYNINGLQVFIYTFIFHYDLSQAVRLLMWIQPNDIII